MKGNDYESDIGVLLRSVLKQHPAFCKDPVGDWHEIAGEQVARHSRPVSLKAKVLVVHAYDSVWKHHLDMNKEVLAEKINRRRPGPEPLVEKILIRVGELPEAVPPLNENYRLLDKIAPKAERRKRNARPSRPLTPEEKTILKHITDPELRAIGTRLLKHTPLEE